MKKWVIVFCLAGMVAWADVPTWRSNYDRALQFIAQGRYQDGMDYLRMAVADKPISEVLSDLDYLPYLQLGICYSHLGKNKLSTEFLDLEAALPAIQQSKTGLVLMKDYRSRSASRISGDVPQAEKVIRDYKRKGYLLPDSEVAQMKEEIRQRCRLPKAEERAYPWYYHYELGLALKGKDDWQRALDSFISALDNRDRPQKFSRIYGMWFVDYYPYYYIGLAHYHLQNWKCAESSFQLSQMMEDIPSDSKEFRNLQEAKAETEKNLLESKE